MASIGVGCGNRSQSLLMGLLHCPLCMGLAVLSALRFSAHALMVFQLERMERDGSPPEGQLMVMRLCDATVSQSL